MTKTKRERQIVDWNAPKCKVCGGVLGLQHLEDGLNTHPNCMPKEDGIECEHGQLARSCNICEYEREILELKENLSAALDSLNHYNEQYNKQLSEKDQEIAELKAAINKKNAQIEAYRKGPLADNAKLSRLTALINDDERAEKVVEMFMMERSLRRDGINDYRAMLKSEMGGEYDWLFRPIADAYVKEKSALGGEQDARNKE